MPVKTKQVKGRRNVRYGSLDELLSEAERLSRAEVRTLGNWSQGQIYEHLARSLDSSIDGFDMSMPAPVRWIMTLLLKRKFLKDKLPAGFPTSGKVIPPETSVEEGLASLRTAVDRQGREAHREPHPAFGNIGRDGWNDFHLRHAEMHMSFLVSDGDATS